MTRIDAFLNVSDATEGIVSPFSSMMMVWGLGVTGFSGVTACFFSAIGSKRFDFLLEKKSALEEALENAGLYDEVTQGEIKKRGAFGEQFAWVLLQ